MLRLKKRWNSTKKGKTFRWYIVGTCPYTRSTPRESTGTDRLEDAEAILAAYMNRVRDEALHGISGAVLFAEAIEEYIEKGGEARFTAPLLERFGTTKLRDVRDIDLTRLGKKLYPGAKPSTLVRQLYGPMQAVWNAAVEAKLATPRKFAKPKVKKRIVKYPKDDWLLECLSAMTTLRQRAAVLFMSFSAARATEVVAVLCRHYDPVAARVTLETTKPGESREIQLPPFVNEALKLLPHDDPEAPLFGYASRFSLTRIIKRACKRAGIKYFSPHKVGRHAFAARFLADGHSLKALMEAGGWKSLNAVAVYSHLERSHIDQAVADVRTPLRTVSAQLLTQEAVQ